jgi:hypothetical protein
LAAIRHDQALFPWINSFGHSLNEQNCGDASQARVNIFEVSFLAQALIH